MIKCQTFRWMGLRDKTAKRNRKLDGVQLYEYALRSLGQREHSVAELKAKLTRRAESAADVSSTLTRLSEAGLTDDRRFAESYASARLSGDGLGRFRVLRDLRKKQVPEQAATHAVDGVYAGTEEATLIHQFLDRKYRGKDLSVLFKEQKHLASAYRRLRMAGFSSSASLAALKQRADMAEDLPEPTDSEDDDLPT